MIDLENKRNYIRRKKYLDESAHQIKTTLEFISMASGEAPNSAEIQKTALAHAQGIEATCWSPRPRPTAEAYQQLISTKTAELCRVLTRQAIAGLDAPQLSKLAALKSGVVLSVPPDQPPVDMDDRAFRSKGDLPNVALIPEDSGPLFGFAIGDEALGISFSRISQQFEYRGMPHPISKF
jgi:hypothetical protein